MPSRLGFGEHEVQMLWGRPWSSVYLPSYHYLAWVTIASHAPWCKLPSRMAKWPCHQAEHCKHQGIICRWNLLSLVASCPFKRLSHELFHFGFTRFGLFLKVFSLISPPPPPNFKSSTLLCLCSYWLLTFKGFSVILHPPSYWMSCCPVSLLENVLKNAF